MIAWKQAFVIFVILFAGLAHGRSVELQPIAIIETEGAAMEFARNSAGALGVDSLGQAHLTFFAPDESAGTPDNAVWYVSVENSVETGIENSLVSAPVRVDDGAAGGGRHPTLTVDESDVVHFAWQDYRHSTPAGSWIDNLEIYYNRKLSGGDFAPSGTRVSWTQADHQGDNGYTPKVIAANGRVFIAWHDFHLTGGNAHIYVRASNENGELDEHPGIEDYRITALEGPIDQGSRWIPDLVALSDEALYVVWGYVASGFQGVFTLEGRRVGLDGSLGPVEVIADSGGTFFDPPRLAVNDEGRIAVIYMVREAGRSDIFLQFRSAEGVWSEAVQLSEGFLSATQPVIRFGDDGLLYAIWQEDLGGVMQAVLAVMDANGSVLSRQIVSAPEEDVRTPVIALHPLNGEIIAAWINRDEQGGRTIVVMSEPYTAVQNWALFE